MSNGKRALLSVSDKSGIEALATRLAQAGYEILSTGGTAELLRKAGIGVTEVADHTGFPEMLDGRVKTLHPVIHGGLLGRRELESHRTAMAEHGIAPIDVLVVNLYPFEQTVVGKASFDETVEQMDIGGPAMIRSAAKNHAHVTVVVDPADYEALMAELPEPSLDLRKRLAAKAFARTAAYDSAIALWFAGQENAQTFPPYLLGCKRQAELRYGENPHQAAAYYRRIAGSDGIAAATQLQGKELSYNNIQDSDAAFMLVNEFAEPAAAIIKHMNPSGVAVDRDLVAAFKKALACDPQSAFGGILAINRALDAALVEAIGSLFLEVIIAPSVTAEAQALLAKKTNLRVLVAQPLAANNRLMIRSISGGYLLQEADNAVMEGEGKVASKRAPSEAERRDLTFAFTVAKHVKSNAIVIAKDGATIGIGAGQMSRVDSVRLACWKAEAAGLPTQGCVLASDAFFPFDDNVHAAAQAGITALIHPGGSKRDDEVIAAADQYEMAMVMTGLRHFNH